MEKLFDKDFLEGRLARRLNRHVCVIIMTYIIHG